MKIIIGETTIDRDDSALTRSATPQGKSGEKLMVEEVNRRWDEYDKFWKDKDSDDLAAKVKEAGLTISDIQPIIDAKKNP